MQFDVKRNPSLRRSHLLALVSVIIVSLIGTDQLFAQGNQSKDSGSLGDIIRFEDREQVRLGLITEVKRASFRIERLKSLEGELETQTFFRSSKYEVVDKFQAKPSKDRPSSDASTTKDSLELKQLRARRTELQKIFERHQKLAKMNPTLMVGDIVRDHGTREVVYAIVTTVEPVVEMEKLDHNGDFRPARLPKWWFFDREIAVNELPERSWSSANGKFTLDAQLTEIDADDNLVLKKSDGVEMKVPLEKLSKSDRAYVKTARKKLDIQPDLELIKERDSYAPNVAKLITRRGELLNQDAADQLVAKDAANIKTISLNTKSPNLSPDQLKPRNLMDDLFSVQANIDNVNGFLRLQSINFARESGTLAFTSLAPKLGAERILTVVQVKDANVSATAEIDKKDQIVAISPSGKTLIVHHDDFANSKLELWSYANQKLERKSSITYQDRWVLKAFLFDDQSGAVMGKSGNLVFFDLKDRFVPTHQIPLKIKGQIGGVQIAQDGKSLFLTDPFGNAISIVDVDSKTCVGGFTFSPPNRSNTDLQINLDGKTATRRLSQKSTIYDLATSQPIYEMDSVFGIVYLGEGIGVFGSTIRDMKLNANIGRLSQPLSTNLISPTRFEIDDVGDGMQVALQRVPGKKILTYASGLTAADLVKFGSGSTVALKIDFPAGFSEAEAQLRSKVEERMTKAGVTLADQSDFELVFKYEDLGSKTLQLIPEVGQPATTSQLKEKRASVELIYKGKRVWGNGDLVQFIGSLSKGHADELQQRSNTLSPSIFLTKYNFPTSLETVVPEKLQQFDWE